MKTGSSISGDRFRKFNAKVREKRRKKQYRITLNRYFCASKQAIYVMFGIHATDTNIFIKPLNLFATSVDGVGKSGSIGPVMSLHSQESCRWSLSIPVVGSVSSIRR
jgi:hypothetical protein